MVPSTILFGMSPASKSFRRADNWSEKVVVCDSSVVMSIINDPEVSCIKWRDASEVGIDDGCWIARRAKII